MIGYHHVLMIIIAVAIILLCESALPGPYHGMQLINLLCSSTIGWLLVVFATNSRHLLNLHVLHAIRSRFQPRPS